jgi:hypothetical protein
MLAHVPDGKTLHLEIIKMNPDKTTARVVGALFIITMVAGMLEAYLVAPILQGPLKNVYPNEFRVMVGALLILVMSVGIAGIATALFPVIKRHSETIAITYVCFRTVECMLLIVGAISSLFLITLSQEYLKAGTPEASYFQTLGILAVRVRYSAYQIAMVILGAGSLMLFYSLLKSKLIPRFISIWGLVGYAFLLASALLDISGVIDTVKGAGAVMYIPGGLFELVVFPLWLIVKGFNPASVDNKNR